MYLHFLVGNTYCANADCTSVLLLLVLNDELTLFEKLQFLLLHFWLESLVFYNDFSAHLIWRWQRNSRIQLKFCIWDTLSLGARAVQFLQGNLVVVLSEVNLRGCPHNIWRAWIVALCSNGFQMIKLQGSRMLQMRYLLKRKLRPVTSFHIYL